MLSATPPTLPCGAKQTNKQAQKQTRKLRTMIGKDPLISTAGLHLVADKQTIKQELR